MNSTTWDRTLLAIECEEHVTEQDLWELHKDLWVLAFPALGDLYETMLHELDAGVTVHPKNPELWFYRGQDDSGDLDQVSRSELRYSFPADEFNNPIFVYEVVHHWFRLGLAVAFERAVEMASSRGVRLEVPSLREELTQTHWLLASVGRGYQQVFPNGDSFTLFSADGWTPLKELETAYHEPVRNIGATGCGCMFCTSFRPKAQSILERADWEVASAELRAEYSGGLALFVGMLNRRIAEAQTDRGRFDWAVLAHARGPGAKAVGAKPEGALVLLPFLEEESAATAPASLAIAIAFGAAKSKPRIALLPLLRATLATTDADALARAIRALMPDKFMAKSPLLRKHLDESLLTSLSSLPERLAQVVSKNADRHRVPLQRNAVIFGLPALVHPKPDSGSLDVVRAWLTSEHPAVRAAVGSELRHVVSGYSGKRMKAYFELALEVATSKLHPEHLGILLERPDEVPPPLLEAMVALLADCDLDALGIEDLVADAAKKVPALQPLKRQARQKR